MLCTFNLRLKFFFNIFYEFLNLISKRCEMKAEADQGFPRGCKNLLFCRNFVKKLHENEELGLRGQPRPLDPLLER